MCVCVYACDQVERLKDRAKKIHPGRSWNVQVERVRTKKIDRFGKRDPSGNLRAAPDRGWRWNALEDADSVAAFYSVFEPRGPLLARNVPATALHVKFWKKRLELKVTKALQTLQRSNYSVKRNANCKSRCSQRKGNAEWILMVASF